jgi:putative tricarboxylic transport membrane protein
MPLVMVVTFTGAFATNGTSFDILILVVQGVLAYVVAKYGYSMAPLGDGICISSTLEQRFQQTIIAMRGKFSTITKYPITCVLLGLAVVLILGSALSKTVKTVLKNSKED